MLPMPHPSAQPPAPDEILRQLAERQVDDLPVLGGRTLAYVYDSGEAEIDALGRAAVAAYAGSNGLDPTAFPSLLAMENELVGFALDMIDAPPEAVGTVTSGGTESVLLAVQTARDARPDLRSPEMIVPSTAHAAFHKAAHYFGVRLVVVPVGDDFRADAEAMAQAISSDTILMVASAPSYAHGVIDPVTPIAAAAQQAGVRCHVDACIGGWVLGWMSRLGRDVPPWTFAVPGVTSISLDTHKYAYAPKGTSLLLYADATLRRGQFFASAKWPGYAMINTTMQSTRSGGPLAGAWAVTRALGVEGYLRLTKTVLAAVDTIVEGVRAIEGIELLVAPETSLLTLRCQERCDPFTVADELRVRGWFAQPQFGHDGGPDNLHLTVSAATPAGEFVAALGEAVAAAVESGPVRVDPDVADFVTRLDADTLSEADLEGLLAAAGMLGEASGEEGGAPSGFSGSGGDLRLPERMAEVNALLGTAPPPLREALLRAFVDRLSRPVRANRPREAARD